MTHNGRTCDGHDLQFSLISDEVQRLRMRFNDFTAIVGMPAGMWHDEAVEEVIATLTKDHARAEYSVQVNENTIRRLASALKYWSGRSSHTNDEALLNEAAFILNTLMAVPEPEVPSVVLKIDGERHDLTPSQRDEVEKLIESFTTSPTVVRDDHHPYPL